MKKKDLVKKVVKIQKVELPGLYGRYAEHLTKNTWLKIYDHMMNELKERNIKVYEGSNEIDVENEIESITEVIVMYEKKFGVDEVCYSFACDENKPANPFEFIQ